MSNTIEYVIKGVDDTRAANATARAEMEKTKGTAVSTSESSAKAVRGFGASFSTLTRVISYGTAVVGAFMTGWKAGTWIREWFTGAISGMTRFKKAIEEATAARKALSAALDKENARKQGIADRDAKAAEGVAGSVGGLRSAASNAAGAAANLRKAEIERQAEKDVAAAQGNEDKITEIHRKAAAQIAEIDKREAYRKADEDFAEAQNAEKLLNDKLAAAKKTYDENEAILKQATARARSILESGAVVMGPQEQTILESWLPNARAMTQAELLKERGLAVAQGNSAIKAMNGSGWNPSTSPMDLQAASLKTGAAGASLEAARQGIFTQQGKAVNETNKVISNHEKKRSKEAEEFYRDTHSSSMATYEAMKKANEDRDKFALEDQLAAARGQAAPAAAALAKAKEAASVAMQAYRSPEFRRQQKDDARAQAQEEKRLQRDLERVDEKKARAEKWGGKIHLTDQEKAALGVRTTRAAEKAARAADARIGINVESISKDMQDFLRKNTLGGNT